MKTVFTTLKRTVKRLVKSMVPRTPMASRRLPLAAAVLLACVAGVAPSADAQPRFGQGPQPRAGACFYEDANFRGDYFCVTAGEEVRQMPADMNDRISSIRLVGNATAVVYRDSRFRGQSARFEGDVRNLKREGWNDLVSSIRVSGSLFGGVRPPWAPGNGMPREGACFYSEANFRGQSFCVERGVSYPRLPAGFNDRVSSVRVRGSVVMIFEDRDFDGQSMRITRDIRNLKGQFNDRLSSVRVY